MEESEDKYLYTYENIYNYKDITKISMILFIILFFIYLLIVLNKIN